MHLLVLTNTNILSKPDRICNLNDSPVLRSNRKNLDILVCRKICMRTYYKIFMTSIPLFVQYFIKPYFRATSPDHNGNASLDKPALMPPLPPWLTRSSGNSASPPQDLSQDEPKDFSPRSRHFSSNSNGEFSFFV